MYCVLLLCTVHCALRLCCLLCNVYCSPGSRLEVEGWVEKIALERHRCTDLSSKEHYYELPLFRLSYGRGDTDCTLFIIHKDFFKNHSKYGGMSLSYIVKYL